LQGKSQIKKIAEYLKDIEKQYELYSEEHELNFGLVQVVYDWAQGKVSLFTEF
jgi:tetrahydromethanopterin S-methyltransferase subunit F